LRLMTSSSLVACTTGHRPPRSGARLGLDGQGLRAPG
jgi:hypothetical protein